MMDSRSVISSSTSSDKSRGGSTWRRGTRSSNRRRRPAGPGSGVQYKDIDDFSAINSNDVESSYSATAGISSRPTSGTSNRRRIAAVSSYKAILDTGDEGKTQSYNQQRPRPPPPPYPSISSAAKRRHLQRELARRKETAVLVAVVVCATVIILSLCWVLIGGILFPSNGPASYAIGGNGPELGLEQSAIAILRQAKSHYDKWPPSVREEEFFFELIRHPGDAIDLGGRPIELAVPRFYALDSMQSAFFDGQLLSRKVADYLGTYTSEEKRRAEEIAGRTIFVSLISYRNANCRDTVENIFASAQHPERIRVGVVDQIEQSIDVSCDVPLMSCTTKPSQALCKYKDHIDVYEVASNLAVGPIFSRHISQRLYRGEYYYMQIDADVTFVKFWDTDIIEQFSLTGNEMAILSTYLLDTNEENYDASTGLATHESRILVCDSSYSGIGRMRRLLHNRNDQPERVSNIKKSPELQPFLSGEFMFARGHFVLTTPYDPHLAMIDREAEEISMDVRAFTHGYDSFAPMQNVAFRGQMQQANLPKHEISFEEHADQYKGKQSNSMTRLLNIIHLGTQGEEWDKTEEDIYGIGKVRLIKTFQTCFGIHAESKITEKKLCDFVSSGMMHESFLQHLRIDGMGIDYNDFFFRFHELLHIHNAG